MTTPDQTVLSCSETLHEYVDELYKSYEIWYSKSVRRVYRWWWFLQAVALLSGFVASVLIAYFGGGPMQPSLRFTLIALPAVGSLAAAALAQFRVYELWRIRETGRIAFQDLVLEARIRAAAVRSEEEALATYNELRNRANAIEIDQKDSYFSLNSPGFVSRFGRSNGNG